MPMMTLSHEIVNRVQVYHRMASSSPSQRMMIALTESIGAAVRVLYYTVAAVAVNFPRILPRLHAFILHTLTGLVKVAEKRIYPSDILFQEVS